MKFSTILALAFSAAPLAQASYARSPGQIIASGVIKITKAVTALDVVINTVSDPDTIDLNGLLSNSSFLLDTINNQTAIANATGRLSNGCADYVQPFIATLIGKVRRLARDLIGKRDILTQASLNGPTAFLVSLEKNATDAFADVLISKVYKPRLALAKKDKADADKALQSIIDAFGGVSN